jgi:hypothetical protein
MNTYKSLAASALFAAVALPQTVLARGQSAFLGVPASSQEAPCWSHSNGTVTNTCTQTKSWCIPAVVERDGAFAGWVYAKANSSASNVSCQAVAINSAGVIAAQTPFMNIPTYGSAQYITLGNVTVPTWGTLYACCNVNPGGILINYHYN